MTQRERMIEAMAAVIEADNRTNVITSDSYIHPAWKEHRMTYCRGVAEGALFALEQHWAVVPREATEKMKEAGTVAAWDDEGIRSICLDVWAAMIEAAKEQT